MRKLIDGHRRFLDEVFPRQRELLASLAGGQKPRFLFITCADSRVQPSEFLGTDPGDLFMGRSLGNIVPNPGGKETEAIAVIEYAVVELGVKHVIICGHSKCGAMKALLHPDAVRQMPSVASWLDNVGSTRKAVAEKYGHLQGDDLLEATIRENVLVQLKHLRRQPCVAERLADGRLQVHGWVFEFEQGRVVAHDPRVDRFVPLAEAYADESATAAQV